jgi:hypothetical protein
VVGFSLADVSSLPQKPLEYKGKQGKKENILKDFST